MVDRGKVRMYQVGFGDCFLLAFSDRKKTKHILIDCGSITEGKEQISRVVKSVISTCEEAGQPPRLELVVGTHRHRDHVGGFADPAWASVEVGEVWMPWTEHPRDPDATMIRNRQSSLALGLARSLALRGTDDDEPLSVETKTPRNETATARRDRALRAMALNALTNEKAMTTLHRGFAGNPIRRFLPAEDENCMARKLDGLDGVNFYVLGPPRDKSFIEKMNPPKGEGYLRAHAGMEAASPASPRASCFGPRWFSDPLAGTTLRDDDLRRIDQFAEEPASELAAALDNAVNNTSLMLVIQVGSDWLLFPGDAQWGAWNAALQNSIARDVLAHTTLYKVGHHGSHNATPRDLIEKVITQPFVSFFSTKAVPQWPDIPRPPLLEAIEKRKGPVARTDLMTEATKAGFVVHEGLYIERDLHLAPAEDGQPAENALARRQRIRRATPPADAALDLEKAHRK